MNDNIKELVSGLIDENSSKEMIEKVAVISNKIDEMITNADKQKSEYTELLKDYAQVIKHSVYKVDNDHLKDEGKKQDFSFDSFAQDWANKH